VDVVFVFVFGAEEVDGCVGDGKAGPETSWLFLRKLDGWERLSSKRRWRMGSEGGGRGGGGYRCRIGSGLGGGGIRRGEWTGEVGRIQGSTVALVNLVLDRDIASRWWSPRSLDDSLHRHLLRLSCIFPSSCHYISHYVSISIFISAFTVDRIPRQHHTQRPRHLIEPPPFLQPLLDLLFPPLVLVLGVKLKKLSNVFIPVLGSRGSAGGEGGVLCGVEVSVRIKDAFGFGGRFGWSTGSGGGMSSEFGGRKGGSKEWLERMRMDLTQRAWVRSGWSKERAEFDWKVGEASLWEIWREEDRQDVRKFQAGEQAVAIARAVATKSPYWERQDRRGNEEVRRSSSEGADAERGQSLVV
jgi:hypothetical protein